MPHSSKQPPETECAGHSAPLPIASVSAVAAPAYVVALWFREPQAQEKILSSPKTAPTPAVAVPVAVAPVCAVAPPSQPQTQIMQNIAVLYSYLLDLSASEPDLKLSKEEIAALPEISATLQYEGPYAWDIKAFKETDLKGHTAVRGVSDRGEPFIGFLKRDYYGKPTVYTLFNKNKAYWLICKREPNDEADYFSPNSIKVRFAKEQPVAMIALKEVLSTSKTTVKP